MNEGITHDFYSWPNPQSSSVGMLSNFSFLDRVLWSNFVWVLSVSGSVSSDFFSCTANWRSVLSKLWRSVVRICQFFCCTHMLGSRSVLSKCFSIGGSFFFFSFFSEFPLVQPVCETFLFGSRLSVVGFVRYLSVALRPLILARATVKRRTGSCQGFSCLSFFCFFFFTWPLCHVACMYYKWCFSVVYAQGYAAWSTSRKRDKAEPDSHNYEPDESEIWRTHQAQRHFQDRGRCGKNMRYLGCNFHAWPVGSHILNREPSGGKKRQVFAWPTLWYLRGRGRQQMITTCIFPERRVSYL